METTQAKAVAKVREYETIYVLSPTTQKEASDKVASRVTEVLAREGGTLTLVENWGRRQLAYPVSKHRRGVYVYLKYTGGGAAVAELERNFRMLDEVLKFQTVKVRDDVDPATVKVDEAVIKFESLEPPEEEEMEETLEQQLGLAEPLPGAAPAAAAAAAPAAPADSEDDSKSQNDADEVEAPSDDEEET